LEARDDNRGWFFKDRQELHMTLEDVRQQFRLGRLTKHEYFRETGILPGLIKCDVEGAELFVFRGAEMIAKALPIVFTEMLRKWAQQFGYSPIHIVDRCAALGHGCLTVQGPRLTRLASMDDETVEANFFLHEEKHAVRIAELAE